ncbi:hypothetical protein AB0I28_12525 [Phytomonospora sp. NPDC050363]|uniref:hypothetical protein n=1 Tax=Phytomonospora sp. NPDC050363 TaxID=3155642 RepID=UPI0033F66352
MIYLTLTEFNPGDPLSDYSVEVDKDGVLVYSECCADRMSLATARLLHEALGKYLTDRDGA